MQEAEDEAAVMVAKAKHLLAIELENARKDDDISFARESARAVSAAVEKVVSTKFQDKEFAQSYLQGLLK